jgi:hypothetical protein
MCREIFFSVSSVAEERLNTEVTEPFGVLCVEALEAQSTRRSWFCNGSEETYPLISVPQPTYLPICPSADLPTASLKLDYPSNARP